MAGMDPFNENHDATPLAMRIAQYEARRRALVKAGAPATHEDAADHLGWSQSSAQRFFSGARKTASSDDEAQIVGWLSGLERDYADRIPPALRVASDNGPDFDPGSPLRSGENDLSRDLRRALRLPVYGGVSADQKVHLDADAIVDRVRMDELLAPLDHRGQHRVLIEVTGVEMEPRYFQGERVIVARNRPPRPGEDCLAEMANGQVEVRIYRGMRGGRFWFDQYNTDPDIYKPEGVSFAADQIAGVHAVLGSIR